MDLAESRLDASEFKWYLWTVSGYLHCANCRPNIVVTDDKSGYHSERASTTTSSTSVWMACTDVAELTEISSVS